jgi:hypothetical protein
MMVDFAPGVRVHTASPSEMDELGDEIAELAAHLHAATYRLLVRLRAFDVGEGWSGGFQSCAHWLSWRTGIAPGAAREKVRVARALEQLPHVSAAFEGGQLSFAKVRALTRVATSANEGELLELALTATAEQLERIVRAWRRASRAEELTLERDRHEQRDLTLYIDDDGSYVVRGRLDPEVGALFARALEAAVQLLDSPADENTTAGQRRADAVGLLAEIALRAIASPQERTAASEHKVNETSTGADSSNEATVNRRPINRADRFQVVVHVDAEALRAESETGQSLVGGVRVPAETSRRIACDASRVVMTHDASGKTIDVGRRTRTVPPAIRRALEHRDRGCRFPGCGNRFCDAHHIRHWADGGATTLQNTVLLCRRHHRAVHEDGFRVVATANEFKFYKPNGDVLPYVPSPPVVSGDPIEALAVGNGHVAIDAWTASSRWAGERVDMDFTVRALISLDEP